MELKEKFGLQGLQPTEQEQYKLRPESVWAGWGEKCWGRERERGGGRLGKGSVKTEHYKRNIYLAIAGHYLGCQNAIEVFLFFKVFGTFNFHKLKAKNVFCKLG